MFGEGLVATYQVDITRDETGAWIAAVQDVPGAHTYGRSLRQARNRIREVLSLWVDDADDAEFECRIHLPASARDLVRRATSARAEAARAIDRAAASTEEVATALVHDFGMSLRDAGELLNLSHQRMQQILTRPKTTVA
jgi:predicted RNase H-like HicB family nuclease